MSSRLYVAKILLLTLVSIFAWQVITSPLPTSGLLRINPFVLVAQGAISPDILIKNAQWFRLFTAAFLHVDLLHLVFNCIGLWYAALILERLLGGLWFLAVFFLGAFCGGLLSVYFHEANAISAGASGGIMGLFGCLLIILRVLPPHIPLRDEGREDALKIIIVSIIPLTGDIFGLKIDIWGHLGGVIGGGLIGLLLYYTWDYNRNKPRLKILAAAIVVASLIKLISGGAEIIRDYPASKRLILQAFEPVERDVPPQKSWKERL